MISDRDLIALVRRRRVISARELRELPEADRPTARQLSKLARGSSGTGHGPLKRPMRGVYRMRGDKYTDKTRIADVATAVRGCVIGLLSAAWIHRWFPNPPSEIWILVRGRKGWRPARSHGRTPIRAFRWSSCGSSGELQTMKWRIGGADVEVTTPKQTLHDIIKYRKEIGEARAMALIRGAIRKGPFRATVFDGVLRDRRKGRARLAFIREVLEGL